MKKTKRTEPIERTHVAIILRWLCCQASSSEPSSCNHSPTRWVFDDVLRSLHCTDAPPQSLQSLACPADSKSSSRVVGFGMSKIRNEADLAGVPCLPCLRASEQSLSEEHQGSMPHIRVMRLSHVVTDLSGSAIVTCSFEERLLAPLLNRILFAIPTCSFEHTCQQEKQTCLCALSLHGGTKMKQTNANNSGCANFSTWPKRRPKWPYKRNLANEFNPLMHHTEGMQLLIFWYFLHPGGESDSAQLQLNQLNQPFSKPLWLRKLVLLLCVLAFHPPIAASKTLRRKIPNEGGVTDGYHGITMV